MAKKYMATATILLGMDNEIDISNSLASELENAVMQTMDNIKISDYSITKNINGTYFGYGGGRGGEGYKYGGKVHIDITVMRSLKDDQNQHRDRKV